MLTEKGADKLLQSRIGNHQNFVNTGGGLKGVCKLQTKNSEQKASSWENFGSRESEALEKLGQFSQIKKIP